MRKGITACLVLFLMIGSVLCASGAAAERVPASRAYFESLDQESTLQEIVKNAGNCSIEGSGILYFVWALDDGSRAKAVFDSRGWVVMIYIEGENGSERIYKREYPQAGSGEESGTVDLEKAAQEMRQAIREQIPASGRMAHPGFDLFDVTGDGCADLCRCVTWGSGMVRTDLVVYDPLEKKLYVLDGYNYSYRIDHVEEDRIVIVMDGPHGYNEPLVKTFGTVRIEDGRLVFLPDSEAR